MIAIPIVLGIVCAVAVNGLADNLVREEDAPFSSLFLPRCPYCHARRKFRDWSAIVSTLFLSGRCLRCGAPRPFRDLAVEAILWVGWLAVWMTGGTSLRGFLLGGFILSSFLLFTVIDFEHRYVLGEAVAVVSLVLIADGWTLGTDALMRVLAGGVAGFAFFLLLYFLGMLLAALFGMGRGAEPLGFGDVMLAALVGFATGWPAVLLAVLTSIILGGAAGVVLLLATVLKKRSPLNATMAYGPYLLIAGILVVFFGSFYMGGIMDFASLF